MIPHDYVIDLNPFYVKHMGISIDGGTPSSLDGLFHGKSPKNG
jgi:hypothetical protein